MNLMNFHHFVIRLHHNFHSCFFPTNRNCFCCTVATGPSCCFFCTHSAGSCSAAPYSAAFCQPAPSSSAGPMEPHSPSLVQMQKTSHSRSRCCRWFFCTEAGPVLPVCPAGPVLPVLLAGPAGPAGLAVLQAAPSLLKHCLSNRLVFL